MSESGFHVLDSSVDLERREWLAVWSRWSAREVFAHPAYLDLFAAEESRSCLAVASEGALTILYPFHLRAIPRELAAGQALRDVSSPYGYGGAYFFGTGDPSRAATSFWEAFGDWAADQGVVSEFIRFDLHEGRLLPYPGRVAVRSINVVRSLGEDPEVMWMDVSHKVRKNVKRARASGLDVIMDAEGKRLHDFVRIYTETMDRRAAPALYRFSVDWFEALLHTLPGMSTLFHVMAGDRVVASELVLRSATSAYSFLGGTDASAFEMRPNDLLKWEAFLWARDAGLVEFVLGGGYRSNDGIFKYKASFAPRGQVPFRVGTRVLAGETYNQLALVADNIREAPSDDSFFPVYRAH